MIKNPEMLKCVPEHLKTKNCVKMQLKIAVRNNLCSWSILKIKKNKKNV